MNALVNIIGDIAVAVVEEEDVATQDTCIRLVKILTTLQQKYPHEFQTTYSNLSPETQNGINVLYKG